MKIQVPDFSFRAAVWLSTNFKQQTFLTAIASRSFSVGAKPALSRILLGCCLVSLLCLSTKGFGQITVFSDNFSANTSASYTTSGAIGASAWTISRSGVDWGGRRNTSPQQLELTNDVGGIANANGWVLAGTSAAAFSSPYQTVLSSNTEMVTWTFNMRQIRTDPAGFGAGSYGVAFILAGQASTSATSGNGYAVVLGQSGGTDPVRLVRYTTGIQGTMANIITSNTSGLSDFGAEYLSIKVTYTPGTNTWELFLRNDGSSAFADPATGVLTSQGTAVDNTHTGATLALMGAYWQGSTGGSQTAFFDNTTVTVACPTISFTATPTNACPGGSNGQIAVSGVSGGTGPYMYSKDNGANYQSGATFTGLTATTYQVVVKDNNGCTSGATPVVVGTFSPPACNITGPDFVCNNTPDIEYSAPGGMSGYSWSINGNGTIPGSTTGASVSVTSGTYLYDYTVTVTVTDGNGCTSSCTKQSLIYYSKPPADITVNPNPVCLGATLDLSITAAASSTVSWTGEGITNSSGTFVPFPNNFYGYKNQTTAVPTTSGLHDYSVMVTTDLGCSNTGTASVMVNTPPSCSISGPTSVCSGGSVLLDAGGGFSSYAWSDGGGTGQTASFTNITSPKTYTVTVTDANGCTCSSTHAVIVNSPPSCSITFANAPPYYFQDTACANSTGNIYTAPGGMSAYSWSILGSGTITSATNQSSVTVTAGTNSYNLYLTVTDGNGCTSTCLDITPVKPSPTCTVNGASTACSNSADNVYTVTTNGSSYLWSISGDGVIVGSATGTSVSVTAGASGTYTISVTTTLFACPSTCSKTVTIEPCGGTIDFSGNIIWEHDDVTGVKTTTVNLSGTGTGSAVTDVNGDFLIATGLTNGSFTLKPVKNINKFNGVNSGDVTAIQQHVTNVNPITDPYKLVCADVNKNNAVNTLDASLLTQALLGNPAANAQFNTSWRFVPTSHTMVNPPWGFPEQRTYTNISSSQTNQNFIGMKIGDVTGSANPANFGGGQVMVLRAQDQEFQTGETIELRFAIDQLNDLAAFQFGLRFDPTQLQFLDLQPAGGLPITVDNFGLYNVSEGEIRFVWAQALGIVVPEATPAFHLRFTALQNGIKLSDALRMDAAVLPGLAFTSKLEESVVELRFDASTTGTNDPVASVLNLQVRPNPFRDATSVSFTLPEAGEAQLRVFDVNGRELLRLNNTYPAGNNSETLRLDGYTTSGILTCELVTPFGVVTRRLVKAN